MTLQHFNPSIGDQLDAILTYAITGGVDAEGKPRIAGKPLTPADLKLFSKVKLIRGVQSAIRNPQSAIK